MTPFFAELERYDAEVSRVRERMRLRLGGPALVGEIGARFWEGGKRLRAVVCLLSGRLCGLDPSTADEAAAGVELIHSATLLHDDVVDDAPTRRTRPTANRIHGSAAAVFGRGFFVFAGVADIRGVGECADAVAGGGRDESPGGGGSFAVAGAPGSGVGRGKIFCGDRAQDGEFV